MWKSAARGRKRGKKNKGSYKVRKGAPRRPTLDALDLDAHIKKVCGVQKEGADFSYKGDWSFKPLLSSRAGSGECLAVRNRPGNVKDPTGAAEVPCPQYGAENSAHAELYPEAGQNHYM